MRESDRAYGVLREQIIDWQLLPGTILTEVEQSSRLGISRTPMREALSRLIADGLVVKLSGRGMVVTDISADDVRELFVLRRLLEEQAVRTAAAAPDRARFALLEKELAKAAAQKSDDEKDWADYYRLVSEFDEAVDELLNNSYLAAAVRSLRTHAARVRRLARTNLPRLRQSAAEHLVIVKAILDGDGELAAHATHIHLHHALQHVLAASQSRERTTT